MAPNPQIAFLNTALRNGGDPANILKLLADEYLHLDEAGRIRLAFALMADLAARLALDRIKTRAA